MCQSFWNSHSIHPWEAIRGKSVLAKFCDSVLQKSAKIRTLQADLRKNYPADDMAQKSKSYIFFPLYPYRNLPSLLPSKPPIDSGFSAASLRSCTALDSDLTALDAEYNKLSDLLAEGEKDNFGTQSFGTIVDCSLLPCLAVTLCVCMCFPKKAGIHAKTRL